MNQSTLRESSRALAISQSLNYHFNVRGIAAQVVIREHCCYIVLIAQKICNPTEAVSWVRQKLPEFQLASVHRCKIYGRQVGRKLPLWCHEFATGIGEDDRKFCCI